MATALAAVLTGPRKLEMRDFPIPEIGPDDGLLRVEANGLCGTDYHQYRVRVQTRRRQAADHSWARTDRLDRKNWS